MTHRLNILLAGGESAGVQALRLLDQSPHTVVGVLAKPTMNEREATLWNAAKKAGHDCLTGSLIRLPEFAAELDRRDVDVLLNVHSLHLIPEAVLQACRVGAFNLHPGPLPEYAGLDVPSWAIYHGETEHGVTLHHMVPKIDAGLIAYETRFPIGPRDTGLRVMSNCVRHGLPLVRTLLEDLAKDPKSIPQISQDLSKRRYFPRRAPEGGRLNWNQPAAMIANHIRAADYSPFPSPWGHPRASYDNTNVGFVSAVETMRDCDIEPGTVGEPTDAGILIAAADYWVEVRQVEVDSRRCKASEFFTPRQNVDLKPAPLSSE